MRDAATLEHSLALIEALVGSLPLCRPRPGEQEPETAERKALCAARKRDQFARAEAAGLLPTTREQIARQKAMAGLTEED